MTPKTLFTNNLVAIAAVSGLLALTATTATAGKTPPDPNPTAAVSGLLALTATTATAGKTPPDPNPNPTPTKQQPTQQQLAAARIQQLQLKGERVARAEGLVDIVNRHEALAKKWGELANSANLTKTAVDNLVLEDRKLGAAHNQQRRLKWARDARAEGLVDIHEALAKKWGELANSANPTKTAFDNLCLEGRNSAIKQQITILEQEITILEQESTRKDQLNLQQQQQIAKLKQEKAGRDQLINRLQQETVQLKQDSNQRDGAARKRQKTSHN